MNTKFKSLAKTVSYGAIRYVPLPVVKNVLPEKVKYSYCHWLVSQSDFNIAIDAFVAFKFPKSKGKKNTSSRPVIVAGPPRVGKSILTKKLASSLEYSILETDSARYIYESISDTDKRHAVKTVLYSKIISVCSGQIILEGATFLGDAKDANKLEKKIKTTLIIAQQNNAMLCMLGCSNDALENKLQAIKHEAQKFNSWVKGLTDTELVSLTQRTIARSVNLKRYSKDNFIPYYDINESSFKEDVDYAVNDVMFELNNFDREATKRQRVRRVHETETDPI